MLQMQSLADGVTVGLDDLGDFEIYFDPERWEVINPAVWGNTQPPFPAEYDLGLISPSASARSFSAAEHIARLALKPKDGDIAWNPGEIQDLNLEVEPDTHRGSDEIVPTLNPGSLGC